MRVQVFAVDQEISHHLAKYLVPKADPHVPLKEERVRKMLCHKCHQPAVCVNKVAFDAVPVIVPVHLRSAHQCVNLVMGYGAVYRLVLAKQEDRRERVSHFPGLDIFAVQPRFHHQFFFSQAQPWMVRVPGKHQVAELWKHIQAQVVLRGGGIYRVFGVGRAFAVAYLGNPVWLVHAEVAVFASVEYHACAPVGLRTCGY